MVADAGGPFVHTVLINVGAEQGVAKGMAAVNERGLIGRVIEVGRRSARVMLLTDFNSRIPVMVEPSRDQAILAGNNSRQPDLIFLPLNPRLSLGDAVVTSGRGGVLPPGLAVGIVRSIDGTAVHSDRALIKRLQALEPGTKVDVGFEAPVDAAGELRQATVELRQEKTRVTKFSIPILFTYRADTSGEESYHTFLNLWLIWLYKYDRTGEERRWSILRFFRFESGVGELGE